MSDRLTGVAKQQNAFQKEASTLVGQVGGPMAALGNSRIRNGNSLKVNQVE